MGGCLKRSIRWMFHIWLIVSFTVHSDAGVKYLAKGKNRCSKIGWYEKDTIVPTTVHVKVPRKKFCSTYPFICTYHEDVIKTINETVKVNHSRIYFDCCNGYQNIHGECFPVCHFGCGHGKCIEPGVCSCDEGWEPPICNHECDSMHHGQDCKYNCNCENGATCDKETGYCHCAEGHRGERCQSKCPLNTFGADCSQKCKCQNDAYCNEVDGSCECEPGFTGKYCEKKCEEGNHGKNCEEECVCIPEKTESCDPETGECICKPGYTGIYCEAECKIFTYGRNCTKTCGCDKQHTKFCQPSDGSCVCKPGWTGQDCSQSCPIGKFGEFCSLECAPCPTPSAICNPETGFCDCPAGTFGKMCHESCDDGWWGSNCTKRCNCKDNDICNLITGKCIEVSDVFSLEQLDEHSSRGPNKIPDCALYHYGIHCEILCNCSEEEICDYNTGDCALRPDSDFSIRGNNYSGTEFNIALWVTIPVILLFALATLLCVLEHKGLISLGRICCCRNRQRCTPSTEYIIGDSTSNPLYGPQDTVKIPVEFSSRRFSSRIFNSPAEAMNNSRAEESRKSDGEIDNRRSSVLASIKTLWSNKSGENTNVSPMEETALEGRGLDNPLYGFTIHAEDPTNGQKFHRLPSISFKRNSRSSVEVAINSSARGSNKSDTKAGPRRSFYLLKNLGAKDTPKMETQFSGKDEEVGESPLQFEEDFLPSALEQMYDVPKQKTFPSRDESCNTVEDKPSSK